MTVCSHLMFFFKDASLASSPLQGCPATRKLALIMYYKQRNWSWMSRHQ